MYFLSITSIDSFEPCTFPILAPRKRPDYERISKPKACHQKDHTGLADPENQSVGSKDDALLCIVLAGGAAALESLLTVPVLCPAGIVVVRVVVIASIVVPGIVEASIVVAGIVLTGTEVA